MARILARSLVASMQRHDTWSSASGLVSDYWALPAQLQRDPAHASARQRAARLLHRRLRRSRGPRARSGGRDAQRCRRYIAPGAVDRRMPSPRRRCRRSPARRRPRRAGKAPPGQARAARALGRYGLVAPTSTRARRARSGGSTASSPGERSAAAKDVALGYLRDPRAPPSGSSPADLPRRAEPRAPATDRRPQHVDLARSAPRDPVVGHAGVRAAVTARGRLLSAHRRARARTVGSRRPRRRLPPPTPTQRIRGGRAPLVATPRAAGAERRTTLRATAAPPRSCSTRARTAPRLGWRVLAPVDSTATSSTPSSTPAAAPSCAARTASSDADGEGASSAHPARDGGTQQDVAIPDAWLAAGPPALSGPYVHAVVVDRDRTRSVARLRTRGSTPSNRSGDRRADHGAGSTRCRAPGSTWDDAPPLLARNQRPERDAALLLRQRVPRPPRGGADRRSTHAGLRGRRPGHRAGPRRRRRQHRTRRTSTTRSRSRCPTASRASCRGTCGGSARTVDGDQRPLARLPRVHARPAGRLVTDAQGSARPTPAAGGARRSARARATSTRSTTSRRGGDRPTTSPADQCQPARPLTRRSTAARRRPTPAPRARLDLATRRISGAEVHADGEIWAQTLWEIRRRSSRSPTESRAPVVTEALRLAPPAAVVPRHAQRDPAGEHAAATPRSGPSSPPAAWATSPRRTAATTSTRRRRHGPHRADAAGHPPAARCATRTARPLAGAHVGIAGQDTGGLGPELADDTRERRYAIAGSPARIRSRSSPSRVRRDRPDERDVPVDAQRDRSCATSPRRRAARPSPRSAARTTPPTAAARAG